MNGPSMPITVAAFDFDETLTQRDSVVPFLRRLAGTAPLAARLLARPHQLGPAIARRDRDQLKAIATLHAFAHRPIAEVEQHAEAYGRQLIERGLRPDTVDRLRWHRESGHRVVIVSASYEHYVHVVGRRLGVDTVLATRLEIEGDVCSGRLDGANCRGQEKVRRLSAWFDSQGLDRRTITLWAYGDSSGDRELLAFADHPVWVTDRLASVAPSV